MDFKDYYGVLGVDPDADRDEIRKAYRKLARKYHPDVSDEPDAEARFKEIGEAWDILGDEEKRATYDQMRAYGPEGPGDFSGFGGFDPGAAGDAESFADFFNSIFSQMGGGGRGGPRGGPRGFSAGFGDGDPFTGFGGPAPGRDVHARLTIRLEEAYAGTEKTVQVGVPETGPDGRPTRRTRTLKVKIPAGVTEGQQIRLRGQGSPASGGRPAGDLFVELNIAPHERFALDGRDVTLVVPLAPWEAALGGRVKVDTLGGPVEVKVPAGTASGGRLRLRGRGLPGSPPGDQYLEFRIVVPPELSERERELFEALAKESAFDPRTRQGRAGARQEAR